MIKIAPQERMKEHGRVFACTEEKCNRYVADCVFCYRRCRAADRNAGDYSRGYPAGERGWSSRGLCGRGFDSAGVQRGLRGDEPACGECRCVLRIPGTGIK